MQLTKEIRNEVIVLHLLSGNEWYRDANEGHE